MPDSSVGVYTRPPSPLPVTGQTADAPQINVPVDDMAAAFNRRHFSDGRRPFLGNQNFNGYRATGAGDAVDAQDLVPLSQVQALISAIQGVPTGTKIEFTGVQVPAGYLRANGQAVLRATYPALWTFAQDSGNLAATQGGKTKGQYGPGDGSTTFTLPDLGDEFIRGLPASGRTIGSAQADETRAHNHSGTALSAGLHRHSYTFASGSPFIAPSGIDFNLVQPGTQLTSADGEHTHALSINSAGGAETRPRNIAYPFLIKT